MILKVSDTEREDANEFTVPFNTADDLVLPHLRTSTFYCSNSLVANWYPSACSLAGFCSYLQSDEEQQEQHWYYSTPYDFQGPRILRQSKPSTPTPWTATCSHLDRAPQNFYPSMAPSLIGPQCRNVVRSTSSRCSSYQSTTADASPWSLSV